MQLRSRPEMSTSLLRAHDYHKHMHLPVQASTVTTNAPPSISDSLPPPPLSAATARCSSQSPYHGDCTEAQARPRFSAVRGDAGGLTAPPSASILPRIALPVRAPLPAPLCVAHHVPPLRADPAARIAPALPTLPLLTPLNRSLPPVAWSERRSPPSPSRGRAPWSAERARPEHARPAERATRPPA